MNSNRIIGILIATLIVLGGCAHKKKIQPATPTPEQQEQIERERIRQEEQLERQRLEQEARERQRLEQEARERQRVLDSIAEAEARKRAMVQTLYVSRMTLTMQMRGGQKISTPASLRWKRGEGAIVSVLPLVGIEMFRAEVNSNGLCIVDKINRRYTRMTMEELQMLTPFSLDILDEWVDKNILGKRNEPNITLSVKRSNIDATAVLNTASMQTDVQVNMQATNLGGYQYVTLERMVAGMF